MKKFNAFFASFEFNVVDWMMLLGIILIPFSTGVTSEIGIVINYCWPIFFITAILIFYDLLLKRNSLSKINLPFLLLGGLLALSTLIAGLVSAEHPASLYRTVSYFLGFSIFVYLLSTSSLLNKNPLANFSILARTLAISGILLASYYVIHFLYTTSIYGLNYTILARTNQSVGRLPWGASNTIAGILNPFIFLTLYLGFTEKKPKLKKYWYYGCAVIFLAVLLTLSRGGMLSLFLGILALFILFKRYVWVAITLVIPALVYVALFSLKGLFPQIYNVFFLRVHSYSNGRMDIWSDSIEWIQHHYTSMIGYYRSLYIFGHSSHNIFLTSFIERGLIGIVLILLFSIIYISWVIKNIYNPEKSISNFYKFVFAATLVSWIHFQIEDFNSTQPYFFYSWCLLALIFAAKPVLSLTAYNPEANESNKVK